MDDQESRTAFDAAMKRADEQILRLSKEIAARRIQHLIYRAGVIAPLTAAQYVAVIEDAMAEIIE